MTDLSPRGLRIGLVLAVLLHLLIVNLYILDVIPQQHHHRDHRLWLHHGGDDYDYVRLAHEITRLDFVTANKYPLGYPLLLAPALAILGTSDHDTLLPVVAAFWGFVMFPLGQLLLVYLAQQFTGRRWLALAAVLIWTALPLVFFALFRLLGNAIVAETYSVHLTWFQMLSDGPSTLVTLASLAAWVWLRRTPADSSGTVVWRAGLLGVLGGLLPLIRYTGVLTCLVIGLALIIERRWRVALIVACVALLVFAPQLAYNWHFYDSPFRTGYTALDEQPDNGLLNASHLAEGLRKVWNRAGILTIPAAAAGMMLAVIGLLWLARHDRLEALVVGLWLASYGVFYSLYSYSWSGGMTRFLMPAYPAAAILAAAALGWLEESRRAARRPALY